MKKNKKILILIMMMITILPEIVNATDYLVCDEKKIPAIVPQMTTIVIALIRIAIPILLVISGMLSFFKVTYSSKVEDEMKKAKTKLINNLMAAGIIFFIFSIANFAVSLVAGTNNKFISCAKCFINLDSCDTQEITNENIDDFINTPITQPEKEKKEKSEQLPITEKNIPGINNQTGTIEQPGTQNQTGQIPSGKEKYKLSIQSGITYMEDKNNPDNKIMIVNKMYNIPKNYVPTTNASSRTGDCKEGACFEPNTWKAYNEMYAKAKEEKGFDLYIISGYRPYSYQEKLYNDYVSAKGKQEADTFSARPGYSEHQTGLAMDIIYASDGFADMPEAKWLNDNCYKYGFIIRYPQGKDSITGYKYESWHIRYVGKDLAEILYNNGNWITMEEYFGLESRYLFE